MQDQVADAVGLDGTAKEASVGKDSVLTFKFLEVARAHAICQRCEAMSLLFSLVGEEVLTQWCSGPGPNRAFLIRIKQDQFIDHIILLIATSRCVYLCV